MSKFVGFLSGATLMLALPVQAEQRVVCTLAVEAGSNRTLVQEGNCEERISSASTFKIAISLMAFDSGIFTASDQPELAFEEGYVDWNPAWRQATTPASWMRDSVVWYSQLATQEMGQEQFEGYVRAFNYGNQDVSGDEGEANGLTNAWLSSSLQISPVEQVSFLTSMVEGALPVSDDALAKTRELLELEERPDGWRIFGKTGAGLPFDEDGERMRGQPFGWFVGWAEKEDRTVVFAQLLRFDARPDVTPGKLARQELMNTVFSAGGMLD